MIRTLVVDDDYRVARIHSASVSRVPGFECVGEAHTAAEAYAAVRDLAPHLLLLDLYLPDENGLSVMRRLAAAGGRNAPDCIVVTAARDLPAVRTAMQLGAIYYLVKPFSFAQLRDQLENYRRWRDEVHRQGEADQATVDALYNLLRPTGAADEADDLPPTMASVLAELRRRGTAVSAAEVAESIGVSRPTAQRHLNELARRGVIRLELAYGATGRPLHLYRPG
jgi:response regulator of citrate/malate metabolism